MIFVEMADTGDATRVDEVGKVREMRLESLAVEQEMKSEEQAERQASPGGWQCKRT